MERRRNNLKLVEFGLKVIEIEVVDEKKSRLTRMRKNLLERERRDKSDEKG